MASAIICAGAHARETRAEPDRDRSARVRGPPRLISQGRPRTVCGHLLRKLNDGPRIH
jgi:hypothetical protein